jgi:putative membrane protein
MTTPSEPGAAFAAIQRLHPASLLFSLGSAARRLLLPGVVILFASRGSNAEWWIMILFVPAAAGALLKYLSYRYRLGAEEMVVREGIITRNERHIPYARVQNINLIQNPLHRLLRVAEVHLETASGDKPEAVIRVLSNQAIDELRRHVFRGRSAGEVMPEAGTPSAAAAAEPAALDAQQLLELSPRELILFGLISNRGTAVVAAALGAAWQLDVFRERVGDLPEEIAGKATNWIPPGLIQTIVLGSLALLVALLLLRLLSVGYALMKFYGFRLRLGGDDLRAKYGLLTRITATIPLHRIQLLSIRSRPLHRWCGRAQIQVETAGGRQNEGGAGVERLWLAPLIREEQVKGLLARVLPEVHLDSVDWQPLAPRARRRAFVRAAILPILATIGAVAAFGLWGLMLFVAGCSLAYVHAKLYVQHTSYAVTDTAVLYRSGWWVRRLSVVRFNKVQSLALRASPFDRRHEMASIHVDTAGAGRVGHRVAISFLEQTVARRLFMRISDEAGATAFRW